MVSQKNIEALAPDDLLKHFTRSRLWVFLIGATVLHVVLLVALGMPTIRGWMMTDAQKKALAAEEAAEAAKAQQAAPAVSTDGATSPAPAPPTATAPTSTPDASAPGPEIPANADAERIQNSEVYKAVTATAKPEEIPDAPDDLGISIDETNR